MMNVCGGSGTGVPPPLVLGEAEVRALVSEADALASARAAFEALGDGAEGVQQPPPMGCVASQPSSQPPIVHTLPLGLRGGACSSKGT
jgi:hypothetical protein|eukprot:COSAG01_NODE_976_length_12364_cov_109.353200_17_plen_88_part_00